MRKFSALIVLVLTVSTLSPALAAAPKPGTTCKTLNQKITSGGLVYTCIKSGSKKVWSKGVKVVAKPTVTTSPTPTPVATTSPTPVSTSTPSATPSATPTPTPSATSSPTPSATPSATASPTPSPSQTQSVSNVVEGYICDANGPASAKDASGTLLYCTKGGDGKSSWRPMQSSGGNGSGNGSGSNSGSSGNSSQQTSYALGKLGTTCTKNGEIGWNGNLVAACKGGIVKYAMQADIPATPAGGYSLRPAWYPTLTQVMMPPMTAEPTCSPSTIKFTKPVIPLDKLAPTIPYGMMVGDHVTPIDHAYLGVKTLAIPMASRTANDYVPVTAPADGVITEFGNLGSPTSYRVVINHGCNVFSVYMVLNKGTGLLADAYSKLAPNGYAYVNIPIKAGEEFGRQRDNMLDFNVFDGTKFLSGFANVYSYLTGDTSKPYTVNYLPFFTDEIRTAMENVLQRTSSPRVGKIDQDVVGAAAGNWFLAGTNGYGGNPISLYENATSQVMGGGIVSTKNFYAWSHLAIAHHEVDIDKWILSTGWFKDSNGDSTQFMLVVGSGQLTPDKLTFSSGAVTYELAQVTYINPPGTPDRPEGSTEPRPVGYTIGAGTLLAKVTLQVNSDNSLSLEFGSAFTAAKRTYNR